jgi:hypothetical protein
VHELNIERRERERVLGSQPIAFDWGIKSDDAHREAADAYRREQLEQYVKAYYEQDLSALNTGIDDNSATRRRMEQLLADNPSMTREDAFLQAMMESAEKLLSPKAQRVKQGIDKLVASEIDVDTFEIDLQTVIEKA